MGSAGYSSKLLHEFNAYKPIRQRKNAAVLKMYILKRRYKKGIMLHSAFENSLPYGGCGQWGGAVSCTPQPIKATLTSLLTNHQFLHLRFSIFCFNEQIYAPRQLLKWNINIVLSGLGFSLHPLAQLTAS